MNWLRRLLRRRDPRSFDPVRPMVKPEAQRTADLERRRAQLDYVPELGFRHEPRSPINLAQWRLDRVRRRARSAL